MFFPDALPDFAEWARKFDRVTLHTQRISGDFSKYDVKPHALLTLLDRGFDDVIWIDSDIIVGPGFDTLFDGLPRDVLVVTEEALGPSHEDPDAVRCRLWGFPVGRVLPFCVNTGVMRVTGQHRSVMERWRELLDSAPYREAQQKDWSDRGVHMVSDQDVFTALLSSRECADVPLKLLKRGADVLQYFGLYGYTVRERLHHLLHGLPPIIHSMGHKPWWPAGERKPGGYARFMDLYLQMSPYTQHAQRYGEDLVSDDWIKAVSPLARALRAAAFGSIPLSGMAMAMAADGLRLARSATNRFRSRSLAKGT